MLPTILVIEDHPMYRDALITGLEREIRSALFASAASVEEVRARFTSSDRIDVLMLDLGLPGTQGTQAVSFLKKRFPTTPLLVLSGEEERRVVHACLAAGAAAFISKTVNTNVIADVLKKVLKNQNLANKWIVPKQAAIHDLDNSFDLTSRQQQILFLLSQGYSNKEIAKRLDIVELTVKSHISSIFKSLSVVNRVQAVQMVRQMSMYQHF